MHCARTGRIVNLEQKPRSTNFVVQARSGEGTDFSEIISLTEIRTLQRTAESAGGMSNTLSNDR